MTHIYHYTLVHYLSQAIFDYTLFYDDDRTPKVVSDDSFRFLGSCLIYIYNSQRKGIPL